ncbi:hypothetical protein D9756_003093 [Leucocoprinus leucothites]|uniref:Galactose oxidase n=1 Tax=Leucocoprinus leucothites TaxID=201217 RepID=A0A8H5G6C9_9AGAR|nr:hypothetical protein D9756_003093 [Leucoagaricus leucothites]
MNLRHSRQFKRPLPSLLLVFLFSGIFAAALTPEARWAQATVVINDALFVYGGKTDPFNSYSYTSAPNNDDLLYLPLSQAFEATNPPWQLLSSSSRSSASQGPVLAWHTLSAFNTSGALLFGGEPGPNSEPPTVNGADSATLLDLSDISQPVWHNQAASWGGEPVRRVYHSSATAPSGVVYIIGGQKADGSEIGFSDHYAFNPQNLAFSQLPAENGPPALYGHTSIMSVEGRLIAFGGASEGSLIPFSSAWVLDTSKETLAWSQLQVDNSSLPAPRRAFAATAIGQGKILIQGGSDASLQNNMDDGWILDTSRSPAVWTPVEQLSQIGPRRDHFAVCSNGLVIFGFGYLNSGPAPANLQIFDPSNNAYLPSYTPPPPTTTPTQTLPGETGAPTGAPAGTGSHHPGTPTSSGAIADPTATISPGDGEHKTKPAVGIAVGVTLGVLGAVAAVIVVVLYKRRQQRREREGSFLLIGDDEDGGNSSLHAGPTIPVATMYSGNGATSASRWGNGLLGTAFGIAGTITAAAKLRNTRNAYQRRDMLADEDTRDFGEWYNARRRDGTTGSSFSLRSILGARFRSREPSTYSRGSGGHRQEKTDPFSDGTSLVHGQEPGTPGLEASGRPHNRRETSYLSTSSYSFLDPFADPVDEKVNIHDTDEYEPTSAVNAVSRYPPPLSTIRTVPPVLASGHPLSPLSEHTSKSSLPSTSNDHTISSSLLSSSGTPAETMTSNTTLQVTNESPPPKFMTKSFVDAPGSPTSIPSTIIPASVTSANIRRSDSWWSKFYRTSFLDRGSAFRSSAISEFRDPNPPPPLDPINESPTQPSVDEQSPASKSNIYAADLGNSMTSLRTADTERIERMAGAMDVVQRVRMRSQRTTGSVSSGVSTDTRATSHDSGKQDDFGDITSSVRSPYPNDLSGTPTLRSPTSAPPVSLFSPSTDQKFTNKHSQSSDGPTTPVDRTRTSETSSPSSSSANLDSPVSGPSVTARVRMYERRLSQDQEQILPTNTRQREERSPKKSRVSVDYGFVPRPNLFVANPDKRNSGSSDS